MPKQDPKIAALIVGLACLGLSLGSIAQGTAPKPATANAGGSSSPVAASDRKFMLDANMAGLAEVQAGKLAQQKGTAEDVKSFGSRMVDDHTKAGDQLKSIAAKKGVELPSTLDRTHEGAIDRLAKSKSFDKDFAKMMVKDHKQAVSLFQKESRSKDADLQGFASSTLPTLEDHLKMAEGLGKSGAAPKK